MGQHKVGLAKVLSLYIRISHFSPHVEFPCLACTYCCHASVCVVGRKDTLDNNSDHYLGGYHSLPQQYSYANLPLSGDGKYSNTQTGDYCCDRQGSLPTSSCIFIQYGPVPGVQCNQRLVKDKSYVQKLSQKAFLFSLHFYE